VNAGLRRAAVRVLLALAALVVWLLSSSVNAHAGTLTRAGLQQRFPSPLIVGERDTQVPVWPLFRQDGTATPLVGYVFESIDLAPIPGFSGTPPDLMIALDAKGVFMDVQVLSQHEPVFLDGLGPEPLDRFVAQYKGLSLRQNIKVGSAEDRHAQAGGANVRIDGVAKATASVRIINQTLMSSALRVARARLGYAAGRDPDRLARVPREAVAAGASAPVRDWQGLVDDGFVQSLVVRNGDVARAFEGTGIEVDAASGGAGAGAPSDAFVELKVVYLSTAVTGRALMGEGGWRHLQDRLDDGDHALLVLARGPGSFVGDDWVRGAVPERLTLKQGELPIEWRDLDLDDPLALPPDWRGADAKVLRVIGPAGLDPARPGRSTSRCRWCVPRASSTRSACGAGSRCTTPCRPTSSCSPPTNRNRGSRFGASARSTSPCCSSHSRAWRPCSRAHAGWAGWWAASGAWRACGSATSRSRSASWAGTRRGSSRS
jgi:transcriptional regulator of nitric oxide reductase